jgi:hypothetical protein
MTASMLFALHDELQPLPCPSKASEKLAGAVIECGAREAVQPLAESGLDRLVIDPLSNEEAGEVA